MSKQVTCDRPYSLQPTHSSKKNVEKHASTEDMEKELNHPPYAKKTSLHYSVAHCR